MLLEEQRRARARLSQIEREISDTEREIEGLKAVIVAAEVLGVAPVAPTAGGGKGSAGVRKGTEDG